MEEQLKGIRAVLAAIRDFFAEKFLRLENYSNFIHYPLQLEVINAASLEETTEELQSTMDYYGNEIKIPSNYYFDILPNATSCIVTLMVGELQTASYMICKSVTKGKTTYSCLYNIEGYNIGTLIKTAGESSWTSISSNDLSE